MHGASLAWVDEAFNGGGLEVDDGAEDAKLEATSDGEELGPY